MKQELGFAEAAAFVYRTPGDSYTVVVGVEDSALPETWEALRVLASSRDSWSERPPTCFLRTPAPSTNGPGSRPSRSCER